MRGRTMSRSATPDSLSYVQINIYDTNIKELRERGVDIKMIIEHIGCRSLIMDVPILIKEAHTLIKEAHTSTKAYQYPSTRTSGGDLVGVVSTADKNKGTRESNAAQSLYQPKSSETVIKDEVLFESKDSKDCTLSITSASPTDAQKNSGDEIFNDNAQECEANDNLCNPSVPTSAKMSMIVHKTDGEFTNQMEPTLSLESSRVDGIHALKLICSSSRPTTVIGEEDVNDSPFLQDHDDDEGDLDIEPGTSRIFTDLSFDDSNLTYGNKLLDFHESMIEQSASPVVKTIDSKHRKHTNSRYRQSTSKDHTPYSTDGGSAQHGESRIERKFLCKFPRCDVKVSWRPRYGKNRLVDHVRIHWGKKVKKCPSCDYVATHQRKILYHHKMFHRDITFTGVESLETKEDMEELLRLWKQCFPDAVLDEFCDSNVARIQRARPVVSDRHRGS